MAKKPNEIRLPVNILLAATLCSSQDETRHYLAGVYLKARDKELRCVSTDGHRMLVISRELPKDVPQWLKDGVIVSTTRSIAGRRVAYPTSTGCAGQSTAANARHASSRPRRASSRSRARRAAPRSMEKSSTRSRRPTTGSKTG